MYNHFKVGFLIYFEVYFFIFFLFQLFNVKNQVMEIQIIIIIITLQLRHHTVGMFP